tara:strand:- start:184 stop:660 length:477 start_codon:yes stop_codon:yes gene_type:complete
MKRPWNRTDLNIYSLATYNKKEINMNICTYVSVVNMYPKSYMISIDYKTLTYQNLNKKSTSFVLQCLSNKNMNIVKYLGKKSGKKFDKLKYLSKNNLLSNWKNYSVLKNTCFLIELCNPKKVYEMQDHCMFVFQIKSFKNFDNKFLQFSDLINNAIIL